MQSSTGFDPKRSKNHGSCLQDGEDISEDSILYLIFPVFPIVFFVFFPGVVTIDFSACVMIDG